MFFKEAYQIHLNLLVLAGYNIKVLPIVNVSAKLNIFYFDSAKVKQGNYDWTWVQCLCVEY